MAASAASRIELEGEILQTQVSTLSSVSEQLSTASGTAGSQLGGTVFGAMNAFVVAPLNGLAARTANLAAEASQLADRMERGVSMAYESFSAHEDLWAGAFESAPVSDQ